MLQTFSRFSKKCSHANIKYTAPAVIRAFSSSQRYQIPDKFKLIANEEVLQYFKDNNHLISQIEVIHTENYLKKVKSCRYDQFRKILLTNALTKMEKGEEHALEKSVNEYVEKVTENAIHFYKDWIEKLEKEWQQSEHYNGQMIDIIHNCFGNVFFVMKSMKVGHQCFKVGGIQKNSLKRSWNVNV